VKNNCNPDGKRILIVNLHSALNLGDDAIMYETLRGVNEVFPEAQITLAANDPESWKKYKQVEVTGSLTTWAIRLRDRKWSYRFIRFPFDMLRLFIVVCLYRWGKRKSLFGTNDQRRLLSAYYHADLVLSCGGGNFSAYRKISPFFLMGLAALQLAYCLNKKIIMLPQSIGPIKGKLQAGLTRRVLGRADLIMVREMISKKFLEEKLKISTLIAYMPDLAFRLPKVSASIPRANSSISNELKIGITIIDRGAQTKSFVNQLEYEKTIISLIVKLLENNENIYIYLFVQSYGPGIDHDDRQIVSRIYANLRPQHERVFVLSDFQDALQIKAAYKSMDCIIGTRMHTGIFAISEAVPVVLIGYQPKTFGVMEALDLGGYCMNIESINVPALYDAVMQLIEDSPNIKLKFVVPLGKTQKLLESWPQFLKV
jgi:colanic acid/amylovoran biosynthesis protein